MTLLLSSGGFSQELLKQTTQTSQFPFKAAQGKKPWPLQEVCWNLLIKCAGAVLSHEPWDIRVDGCIHEIRRQQVADEQQQRLDPLPLRQPQVAHGWHCRPVGPQERHRPQDGSQSCWTGRGAQIEQVEFMMRPSANATHLKEWRRCWSQRWCEWARCRGRRSRPFSERRRTLLCKTHSVHTGVQFYLLICFLLQLIKTWWPLLRTGRWCWTRVRAETEASGWWPTSQVCSIHRWSSAGRREWWEKSPAGEQNKRKYSFSSYKSVAFRWTGFSCVVRWWEIIQTRLSAKLSRAVPLWNRTVRRVVVVEIRRPTFLLITTHRDSKIYTEKTTK